MVAFFVTVAVAVARTEPVTGISMIGYSIQVGAFSDVRNAERLTAKLQGKGIEAFYFKRENGFYAVRFGDFPHRDEARKTAKRLVSEQIIATYFIAPPQITAKQTSQPDKDEKKPVQKTKKDKDMGFIAARTAERFVGIPYRWGGNTVVDGMDCSGFARAVYNLCGVNIPRTSAEQYKIGRKIDREGLEDGDLVFFGSSESQITHVGIYVGNNHFVHAPKKGEDIKVSTLNDNGFSKKFMGGRRYF